ncbi:MAG: YHS domain-containing protein [Pseudomonadota bacterium]
MKTHTKMMFLAPMMALVVCGIMACADKTEAAPAAAEMVPAQTDVPKVFDAPPAVGTKARCPVMGGEFTVTDKTERSEYQGKHVVFCCPGCKPSFDKDPEKFLNAK